MTTTIEIDVLKLDVSAQVESPTVDLDLINAEVSVNVSQSVVEICFYDAAIFDPDAFASWLLALPEYANETDATADLGTNKLYWISAGTDTEFPNTLKRTPST